MCENNQKILSMDVGMRHLAYCVVDVPVVTEIKNKDNAGSKNSEFSPYKFGGKILFWGIINLCNDTKKPCMGKTKKGELCGKKANYCKGEMAYCKTHAKKVKWKIPKVSFNKLSEKKLKTTKNEDLKKLCAMHECDISSLGKKPKKADMVLALQKELSEKYFEPANSVNSNTMSYVDIAKSIRSNFQSHFPEWEKTRPIEHVIIENQMGKMAVRMTILQGMLTQYFVGREKDGISFISPKHKLKPFEGSQKTYAERKKLGIKVMRKILEENESLKQWDTYFNKHAKRDDLADCFLQIIGYQNQVVQNLIKKTKQKINNICA